MALLTLLGTSRPTDTTCQQWPGHQVHCHSSAATTAGQFSSPAPSIIAFPPRGSVAGASSRQRSGLMKTGFTACMPERHVTTGPEVTSSPSTSHGIFHFRSRCHRAPSTLCCGDFCKTWWYTCLGGHLCHYYTCQPQRRPCDMVHHLYSCPSLRIVYCVSSWSVRPEPSKATLSCICVWWLWNQT